MAVAAGSIIDRQDCANRFNEYVTSPAHAVIVYHSTNRHTYAGVTAAASAYGADNPSSGISAAGMGASDNVLFDAQTVYNHMKAATYNLTHIRDNITTFWRNENGTYVLRYTFPEDQMVAPTTARQSVANVTASNLYNGRVATASGYNQACTDFYNRWNGLRANNYNIRVDYCHTSCHTSCHSSRGRR